MKATTQCMETVLDIYSKPTLRDQFAMAALTGVLSCPDDVGSYFPDDNGPEKHYAKVAYDYADAMMEARKVKP